MSSGYAGIYKSGMDYGRGGHYSSGYNTADAGHGTVGVAHEERQEMSPVIAQRRQQIEQMRQMQLEAQQSRRDEGMLPRPWVADSKKASSGGFFGSLFRSAVNFVGGATIGFATSLVKGAFCNDQGKFDIWKTLKTVATVAAVGAAIAVGGPLVGLALGAYALYKAVPKLVEHAGNVISNYKNGNYEAAEEASWHLGESATETGLAVVGTAAALKAVKGAQAATAIEEASAAKTQLLEAKDGFKTAVQEVRDAKAAGTTATAEQLENITKAKEALRAARTTAADAELAATEAQAARDAIKYRDLLNPKKAAGTMRDAGKELINGKNWKATGNNISGAWGKAFPKTPAGTPATPPPTAPPPTTPAPALTATERAAAAAKALKDRLAATANSKNASGLKTLAGDSLAQSKAYYWDPTGAKFLSRVRWENVAASQTPGMIKQDSFKTVNPYDESNLPGYDGTVASPEGQIQLAANGPTLAEGTEEGHGGTGGYYPPSHYEGGGYNNQSVGQVVDLTKGSEDI